MDLGFEIQRANVGIRISMLEIPYVLIFRQFSGNFEFLEPKLPKNGFWIGNSEK